MAVDLFSHTVDYGGAISADGVDITFTNDVIGASGVSGLFVQQMSWNYTQAISRIFDVTSTQIALVSGRTQGGGNMAHVLGPSALSAEFFSTFGDVCYADSNTLTITGDAGCESGSGTAIEVEMNNVVIASYNGSINAQDMLLNNSIQFVFTYLTYDDGT